MPCGKKSDKLIFPKNIPEIFIKNFIIGFLDTDGSVFYYPKYKNRFQIVFYSTSKIFLEEIRNYILQHTNINAEIKEGNKHGINKLMPFVLSFYGKNALQVGNWLYENIDEKLRLSRKYNKYMEYKYYRDSHETIK